MHENLHTKIVKITNRKLFMANFGKIFLEVNIPLTLYGAPSQPFSYQAFYLFLRFFFSILNGEVIEKFRSECLVFKLMPNINFQAIRFITL